MNNKPKQRASVFIETYGCQMNKYDSELVAGLLAEKGYSLTTNSDEADVILVNTCSVRQHAETRALGRIASLKVWKEQKPYRKLGVIGCMAQRMGPLLLEKTNIDFIMGPDAYRTLPDVLDNGHHAVKDILDPGETYTTLLPHREPGISGWIAISRGCSNFCSYCIVPYTRGEERSRPSGDIIRELEIMASSGYKEVTLLGQNVNSYHDGEYDFADLLSRCAGVEGILRIRFLTSHPRDLTDKTIYTLARSPKLCPHVHLPVQSGSDRVLELMNRKYTREHYLDRIKRIRQILPDASVTTDILVGFPGESERDFEQTLELMQVVRFDEAFMYAYSPRKGTRAFSYPESLKREEKLDRLQKVIRLQRSITAEIKRSLIGSRTEVLTESPSKRDPDEMLGRTPRNHTVVIPVKSIKIGETVKVLLGEFRGSTLIGKPVY